MLLTLLISYYANIFVSMVELHNLVLSLVHPFLLPTNSHPYQSIIHIDYSLFMLGTSVTKPAHVVGIVRAQYGSKQAGQQHRQRSKT